MQCKINKNLFAFKLFLFGFLGAIGCCWPYLTLHMNQLGLSVEEIAVINLILPFLAAFCKPIIGIIADKTGRYKLILSVMLLATGTSFTSLLLIPPIEKPTQHPTTTTTHPFICTHNGSLLQTPCSQLTDPTNWTIIQLTQCTHHCHPHLTTNLCLSSQRTTTCMILNPNDKLLIPVLFKHSQSTDHQCQIDKSQMHGFLRELQCPECPVECTGELADHNAAPQSPPKKIISLTFWLYLGLRSIAEVILSACQPLSDALNLTLVARYGGSFGRQQMMGILALGVCAPLSGYVIDLVSKWHGSETYASCFIMSDVMLVFSIVSLYFVPSLELKRDSQGMGKGLRLLLSNRAVLVLFVVCFALGIVWGYMEVFLYLYLLQRGGTRLLIGLTQLVSVVPSLPLLYGSKWILRRVGHVNLLIFAFFVYSVRCVGYVFLVNPWWSLVLESTRVFSVYLPRIAFTIYADALTSPELKVTTQSLVFLLHFDIGRGVGSLIGGTLKEYLGDTTTFQIISVYSGLLGCGYFSLYHFYLKYRDGGVRIMPTINNPKVQENDTNNSVANGHVNRAEKPLLSSQC